MILKLKWPSINYYYYGTHESYLSNNMNSVDSHPPVLHRETIRFVCLVSSCMACCTSRVTYRFVKSKQWWFYQWFSNLSLDILYNRTPRRSHNISWIIYISHDFKFGVQTLLLLLVPMLLICYWIEIWIEIEIFCIM